MNFQRYVINQLKTDDFPLDRIGNMDETPMCFDMQAIKHYTKKVPKPFL